MIREIDNTTFKANLVTTARVKHPRRFKNITKIFMEKSKNRKEKTLYLEDIGNNRLAIHTHPLKTNTITRGEEIYTFSMDEHFDKYTDEQIAKRFISAFKILDLYDQAQDIILKINRTKKLLEKNTSKIIYYTNIKHRFFADNYKLMAEYNNKTINTLKNELALITEKFNVCKKKRCVKFPELKDINIK